MVCWGNSLPKPVPAGCRSINRHLRIRQVGVSAFMAAAAWLLILLRVGIRFGLTPSITNAYYSQLPDGVCCLEIFNRK
ncbi:hypothetical protein PS704_05441 [Pseudomonas fluorescens]|uniref:Uncharacterized protein n=1 Tax=Pseudomonas fluorescens TaxID=294 RepID=A0A5E7FAW6_PSEFL|nr:hypothetical protein PS704_05441 [Pseudomonas fluorescens]